MASIEGLCERIFSSETALRRSLLGGLLCLTIIGLPVAAGYLYRLAQQAGRREAPELPPWNNWSELIRPGWCFLALLVLWLLLPLGLFWLLGWLVEAATGGILWWIGYLIVMAGLLIAPVTFVAALARFQLTEQWEAAAEVGTILRRVLATWQQWLLPALLFAGLIMVALPLLPFAFFLGMTVLIPYLIVIVFGSDATSS